LSLVRDEEIKTFVDRILDFFTPHIMLGISDMLPPDGDIEKVRMISILIFRR